MDLKKSLLARSSQIRGSSAIRVGLIALLISVVVHLILLGPTARWISTSLLPKFQEHEIDLEMFEAKPLTKKEKDKFRKLPKDKKVLGKEDKQGKGGKKQKAQTQTKKGPWGESESLQKN